MGLTTYPKFAFAYLNLLVYHSFSVQVLIAEFNGPSGIFQKIVHYGMVICYFISQVIYREY